MNFAKFSRTPPGGCLFFFTISREVSQYAFLSVGFFKGTSTDNPKKSVSKSIVHVIKHAKFQLYRVHPDGIILENLTFGDKFGNKRV